MNIDQTALMKVEESPVVQALNNPASLEQFTQILGTRAPHFLMSLKVLMAGNAKLLDCTLDSIMTGAMQAAALNLSFDPSIGEAYLVPFRKKDPQTKERRYEATFIPGYKGLIQLALRTGKYITLNARPITKDALKEIQQIARNADDPQHEIIRFLKSLDFFPELKTGAISGYAVFFQLRDGFSSYLFMTKQECLAHGKQYSRSFNSGPWKDNEDVMCLKTVVRQLLMKYAPKSKEMKTAIELETRSLAMLEEPRGDYAPNMLQSAKEMDDELYGEDPKLAGTTPEPELEKAYNTIRAVFKNKRWTPIRIKESVRQYLGVENLEECKNLTVLRAYYKDLVGPDPSQLENLYTTIQAFYENHAWPAVHVLNSQRKHLGIEDISDCTDIEALELYYEHLQDTLQAKDDSE